MFKNKFSFFYSIGSKIKNSNFIRFPRQTTLNIFKTISNLKIIDLFYGVKFVILKLIAIIKYLFGPSFSFLKFLFLKYLLPYVPQFIVVRVLFIGSLLELIFTKLMEWLVSKYDSVIRNINILVNFFIYLWNLLPEGYKNGISKLVFSLSPRGILFFWVWVFSIAGLAILNVNYTKFIVRGFMDFKNNFIICLDFIKEVLTTVPAYCRFTSLYQMHHKRPLKIKCIWNNLTAIKRTNIWIYFLGLSGTLPEDLEPLLVHINSSITHWSVIFVIVMTICIILFAIITIWTRASGPRVRLEQLSRLTWKDILFMLFFIIFMVIIVFFFC